MSGGGHHVESGGGGGAKSGESFVERLPIIGPMLKEIASVGGLKSFLSEMAQKHVLPVLMKIFDPFKAFFGGGHAGGGGHEVAHAGGHH